MDDFERRRELRRQKREEMRLETERWVIFENIDGAWFLICIFKNIDFETSSA